MNYETEIILFGFPLAHTTTAKVKIELYEKGIYKGWIVIEDIFLVSIFRSQVSLLVASQRGE